MRARGFVARLLGVGALLLALVAITGSVADRAVAEEEEPGGSLSVVVTDDSEQTPTPSPSATPLPPAPVQGGPKAPVAGQQTITEPAEVEEALGDNPFELGGILSVSGLTASASPSFIPANGDVWLTFTVRNNSATAFDSTAVFWVDNVFDSRISARTTVRLDGLAPDETRRVSVSFSGLGQHTVLQGNVRLTPPETVEGTELSPLQRDTLFMLPPLFALAVGVALAITAWLLSRLLGPRGLGLVVRRPGGSTVVA
jgi:hypothetical protein